MFETSYLKLRARYDKLAEKHKENGVVDYDKLAKDPNLLKAMMSDFKRQLHPKKKKQNP